MDGTMNLNFIENSFGYLVILLPEDKGRTYFTIRFSQTSRYIQTVYTLHSAGCCTFNLIYRANNDGNNK